MINILDRKTSMQITLSVVDNQDNYGTALKLDSQFAYPSQEKLKQLKLIKNACEPWCNNKNLKEENKTVSKKLHNLLEDPT